jgi:hypothetical protein
MRQNRQSEGIDNVAGSTPLGGWVRRLRSMSEVVI